MIAQGVRDLQPVSARDGGAGDGHGRADRRRCLACQPRWDDAARRRARQSFARSVAQIESASPQFELCPGVLETRRYAQLGIPAFAYGAGRLDVSHGPDEFIDEAAMRNCAAIYALFAGELLE